MINEEILQKAIEKAKKNKYIIPIILSQIFEGIIDKSRNLIYPWRISKIESFLYFDNSGRIEEEVLILSVNDIIFSHEFAKAFWGEDTNHKDLQLFGDDCRYYSRWKLHLNVMVLEEEPLKYLEKFL